jgi:hypothetical protein
VEVGSPIETMMRRRHPHPAHDDETVMNGAPDHPANLVDVWCPMEYKDTEDDSETCTETDCR